MNIADLVTRYVVAPVIVLIGMYIIGVLIGAFLHIGDPFPAIFTGVGGITAVAGYFAKFWNS